MQRDAEIRKWVILFTSVNEVCNEWEAYEGTLEWAIERATCDGRHLNYGRNGFRIVPDECAAKSNV